jgi:hypothetical protein
MAATASPMASVRLIGSFTTVRPLAVSLGILAGHAPEQSRGAAAPDGSGHEVVKQPARPNG